MEKKDYYCNLKRYDNNGRRVAIFGKKLEGENVGKLAISIIRCSRKDQFSKKFARAEYESYTDNGTCVECHPEAMVINMKEADKPKYSFQWWINDNFYRKHIDRIEYDKPATVILRKKERVVEVHSLYK